MPVLLTRSLIALLGACIVFLNANLMFPKQNTTDIKYIGYHETKEKIVFYLVGKTTKKGENKKEEIPTEVVINKDTNNGTIKIKFRNKDMEIDIEHSGDLSNDNKEYIDRVVNKVTEVLDNSQTISAKTKGMVGNFIKELRKSIGKLIIGRN